MNKNKRFKIVKKAMIAILILAGALLVGAILYMQHPKFGKAPNGQRLERIKQSPNYKDGKFQNKHFTPMVSEGYSMTRAVYDFAFTKFPRTVPTDAIPSLKTDLRSLPITENVLVWFGHSSYFIQLNGKRFLMDPVFSGNASPIPNSSKAFKGTDIYTAEDMPEIDYLLISHDHYDHLDYPTIVALRPKVKQVVCGLGVGAHFEYWKYDRAKIIEKDWNESVTIDDDMTLYTTTARHFSGRGLKRDNTLWLSYVLQTPDLKLYLGGDSGYDTHFAEIGERFGGFDLAILDNGQYNEGWREIHLLPEEVLQAAQDLDAKRVLPVHSAKFKLGFHAWDEPLIRITENNKALHIPLVTPIVGELVNLNDSSQQFKRWWEELR